MHPIQKAARVAGLLYLMVVVTGVLGLMVLPHRLFVPGDAAATAAKILASQPLYRIFMLNGLVSILLFLFVALALYQLLKDVNQRVAAVMVILVLVQIPLGVREVMNEIAALDLVRGDGFWSAFDAAHRDALAVSLLDVNNHGIPAVEMLWGLWLFPLAMLVFRSGFLPRFLGVWLWINGLAYVMMSGTGILWPQYSSTMRTIAFPAMLGEIAFTFWLLIVGARLGNVTSRAQDNAA